MYICRAYYTKIDLRKPTKPFKARPANAALVSCDTLKVQDKM